MAKTVFSTSNPLTKKAWVEKLFRDTVKESYFSRFQGNNSDSIVQVQNELTKQQGDTSYFGIRMRLSGAGVNENQTLEGNEEKLTDYNFSVVLKEYAHAVRDAGPLDRQRSMFSIDEESKMAIKDWMAEKIDQLHFDSILASPTKIFYGGSATSTATLGASDKLTPTMISKIKAWCKTGGNRTQTPLRPVTVDGKKYYVLLVHPDDMYDLKTNSDFLQARREAETRGKENPIFSGSAAIWDGVVIHEHENISLTTNWGSGGNVAGAKCVFMGAQSLVWAWGRKPTIESEVFDYKREHGFAISMIAKCGKPVFNSLDYGSVGVYVARTQISDV